MTKTSINLPFGRRLDLRVVKERQNPDNSILLEFKSLFKVRKGNKVSRLFSKIFEKKKLKGLIGKNLLFVMLTTSLIPQTLQAYNPSQGEILPHIETPLVVETEAGVHYPTKIIRITQNYSLFHQGIDFDGITGDPIYPISVGKVETIEYSRFGYGNSVYINHGNGIVSLYAHLNKIYVTEGTLVTRETILGEMGATGRAYGDHLHLEVYDEGKRINPLSLLN